MERSHNFNETTRIDRRPDHRGKRLLIGGLAALVGMTTAVTASIAATPASAATVNGIATIASPGTTTPLTSGTSTTQFTASLPAQAACSGDTATNGYHVFSYLVHKGTALSGVTFTTFPSSGYGFVDTSGTYYGPANTAIGTGQIVSIPNNFEWGPLVSTDGVALSTFLYTGSGSSASGIWEAGLVCANTSGAVVDNWNTEVTFAAHASDPNGFNWTAVPGTGGTAPAFTSAASTTFVKGSGGTFTPTASGSPTPVITESGALPAGVTYSGGVLSGTPTVTGSFPINFTASNGIGSPISKSFALAVVAIEITTRSLPTAHRNTAYSATLSKLGGVGAVKWTKNVVLPKGLLLNATTGAITGTVSKQAVIGTFPITFTVTDLAKPVKNHASVTLSITVTA